MQTIRYELIAAANDGKVALITFDEQGSPVNTMSRQWQDDLAAVTAQLLTDRATLGAALKGIVLASAKSSFFAGADLKATMRLTPADAPAGGAAITDGVDDNAGQFYAGFPYLVAPLPGSPD